MCIANGDNIIGITVVVDLYQDVHTFQHVIQLWKLPGHSVTCESSDKSEISRASRLPVDSSPEVLRINENAHIPTR